MESTLKFGGLGQWLRLRGRHSPRAETAFDTGAAHGPLVGGYLYDLFGSAWPFYLTTLVGMLPVILFAFHSLSL